MPSPPRRSTALGDVLTGDRALWWGAFAVFVALGTLWALSSPLGSVPDEPAHAIKAAAVARGQLLGRTHEAQPSPPHVWVQVPRGIALASSACFALNPTIPAGCQPPIANDSTIVEAGTTAGTYPPVFYLLVGWPSRLLTGRKALYAMRLCSVLAGAALLASGLASARKATSGPFTVAGAALAATPMALFLIGSTNPSGFEIAAAFAAWLAWLELVATTGPPSTRLLIRVGVVSAAFLVARPLSPVLFVLAVATVVALAGSRARLDTLRRDRRVAALVGAIVVVGAAAIAWILWFVSDPAEFGAPVPGLTFRTALHMSYDQLWFRTRQLFGVFGWLDTGPPASWTQLWLVGVVVLIVIALVLGTWRQRFVVVMITAAAIVFPLVAEAASAPRIGFVWQGRYTLPLAIGVPVVAAWVIAARPGRTEALLWTRRSLLVAVAVGMATAQFFAHAVALTRYVVGLPAAILAYLHGTGWAPPLGRWGLFALAVTACGAYVALLVAAGWDRRPTLPVFAADDELAATRGTPVAAGPGPPAPIADPSTRAAVTRKA